MRINQYFNDDYHQEELNNNEIISHNNINLEFNDDQPSFDL